MDYNAKDTVDRIFSVVREKRDRGVAEVKAYIEKMTAESPMRAAERAHDKQMAVLAEKYELSCSLMASPLYQDNIEFINEYKKELSIRLIEVCKQGLTDEASGIAYTLEFIDKLFNRPKSIVKQYEEIRKQNKNNV